MLDPRIGTGVVRFSSGLPANGVFSFSFSDHDWLHLLTRAYCMVQAGEVCILRFTMVGVEARFGGVVSNWPVRFFFLFFFLSTLEGTLFSPVTFLSVLPFSTRFLL